jgi:valyl-tRNA synthetase
MSADLPPQYAPGDSERALYEEWVAAGYFTPPAEQTGAPAYCIVIPPPNVTGQLHMGHALNHSLMDVLVRRRRMQGYDTLWLPGMDHAGIATQNVVERELAAEGKSRHELGREEFLRRVWLWKEEYGGRILGQMRRLGESVDWTRERFTMDEGLSRAVQTIFKMLYDEGLIYRAERIINWCPRCLTALSDIEVDHIDDEGELVSIRYGDGDSSVVVATTRVETMLGDTGVAVHPDDARYQHLIGTEVELPLTGRRIPIVADDHVDPAFGTGAVKVTPAHDPNDFDIGQRHNLATVVMMDERAVVTVPGPFEGLDRFEARPAVTAALREQGRIVAEKRPYVHAVGHCSRCKTVVEPRLSLQWFVRVEPLAKAAGDAVRDGRTTIHPTEMAKRYFDWVDDMHDWCISRQLWWGHRIPVWYGPQGETVVVGPDEPPPSGDGWQQDEDVLDTWFSSALWPMSTLGWPADTDDMRRFYPTSVLLTGYDIIFFWVARMMMFDLFARDGQQPFDIVALTGLIRDDRGRKMSKSAGNGIDPLDWIDAYGADATRWTLVRGASPGTDVSVGEAGVQASRNFINKIWNGVRFGLGNGVDAASALLPRDQLGVADRWILSRLNDTVVEVDALLEDFQFAKATDALFHFAWDDVFDWYIEIAKTSFKTGGPAADASRAVLGHVLDVVLRLLHPIVPFVTEQLWRALTGGESIVVAEWPSADDTLVDRDAEAGVARLQDVVTEVRRFRAEQGLRPRQKVGAAVVTDDEVLSSYLAEFGALTDLTPEAHASPPDGWPVLTVGSSRIALDMSGAIDVAAERARLTKDLEAARKDREAAEAKLANPEFTAKAPEKVVATMRARLEGADQTIERLGKQLDALPST